MKDAFPEIDDIRREARERRIPWYWRCLCAIVGGWAGFFIALIFALLALGFTLPALLWALAAALCAGAFCFLYPDVVVEPAFQAVLRLWLWCWGQ